MGNAGQYYVSGISVLILVYFNDIVMILTYCDVFFIYAALSQNWCCQKLCTFLGKLFLPKNLGV